MKTKFPLPPGGLPGGLTLHTNKENTMHPINPATGLPMTGEDYSGVDVGGSPYGTDVNSHHHPWSSWS